MIIRPEENQECSLQIVGQFDKQSLSQIEIHTKALSEFFLDICLFFRGSCDQYY